MRSMPTVNELAQKTGYVMGPQHPRAQQMMREEAAQRPAQSPPNYREAGNGPDSCAGCRDYQPGEVADGRCFRFGVPVEESMVCDAVTPADEEGGETPAIGMGPDPEG